MAEGSINEIKFLKYQGQTKLQSMRCTSRTQNGERCKNRTRKSRKCWIHLGKEDNLRIKPSTISNAGLGLFTYKKPFQRGQEIGKYFGRNTTKRELDWMYPGDQQAIYAICENDNDNARCINANHSTDTPLRYINDKRNRRRNNVKFIRRNATNQYEPYAKTKKRVQPGRELFVSYGPTYW